MKKRLLFILCFAFVSAGAAAAQTKTVTNSDLEKFRQKRLAAERDYRENYERLGFPSPEELARRQAESQKEMEALAARLRTERLEREKAEALQAQMDSMQSQINYLQYSGGGYPPSPGAYFYGAVPFGYYNYGYGGNFRNNRFSRFGNSERIRQLRETDFINRRNGYVSPFRLKTGARPRGIPRGGRRNR